MLQPDNRPMLSKSGFGLPISEREFREGWMRAINNIAMIARAKHVDAMCDKANDNEKPAATCHSLRHSKRAMPWR